jgi:hypothetical protein
LKNTTFHERGKATEWGDAIPSKEQHIFPLAAILENRRLALFNWVDMVSGIPPVGITQNQRFFF